MAKIREILDWVTLDVKTFPKELKALDDELREGFAMIKEIKARYEAACDKVLITIAPALDAATKAKLKIGADGKFPVDTVRKFSYMYGVGVATAKAPGKTAAKGSISLG
jgi:hypothetical protein